MGRPKGKVNYPKEIEDKVRKLLWDNPTLSGKQLKYQVEEGTSADYTVRTYQSIKEKVLPDVEALKDAKSEQPWTTGSLAKVEYSVPAEAVPLLVEETKLRLTTNLGPGQLTNREAIWFARLYPALYKIARELFPNEKYSEIWHGMASIASREYAYREFSSQLAGKTELDVWDLDYWLLIKRDTELWQSLKLNAEMDLTSNRESWGAEKECEPPRIKSFTKYFRQVSPEDLELKEKEENK